METKENTTERGKTDMTDIRTQVFEILRDIPDDKLGAAMEVLKGLRALYRTHEMSVADIAAHDDSLGIFNKYANPDLIPAEKEAWGMAVKDKYAAH